MSNSVKPISEIAAIPFLSPRDYKEFELWSKHKFENTNPCLNFLLQAYEAEQNKNFGLAMHHYISLAEIYGREGHKDLCLRLLQWAEELAHRPRKDITICNFFERVQVTLLQSLSLYSVARLKEKIRTLFIEKIQEVCSLPLSKKPTCFICFNAEEIDVREWLSRVLIPDLKTAGIEPVCSLENFRPGISVTSFESLARTSDYVLVICTPELKRKAANITSCGVYREINEHIQPRLKEKVWPILFRGSYEQACPTCFPDPWCVTATPYDYYKILEIIFESRGLDRGKATQAIEELATKSRELYFAPGLSRVIPDAIPYIPSLAVQAISPLGQWKNLIQLHQVPLKNPHYFERHGIDLNALFYRSNVVVLVQPPSAPHRTGKTSVALDYVHKAWRYDRIFWVDASNLASFSQEELARPGFLLILDNVDSWKSIEVHFPSLRQNLLGHIIITSNNCGWKDVMEIEATPSSEEKILAIPPESPGGPTQDKPTYNLISSPNTYNNRGWKDILEIEVPPFSDEETLFMLREISGSFIRDESISHLISSLKGDPVLIRQAAETVREQKISFATFLEQYSSPKNTPLKGLEDRWLKQSLSAEVIAECLQMGKKKWEEHLYPLIRQMTNKRTLPYKEAVIPFFEQLLKYSLMTQEQATSYLHTHFKVPLGGQIILDEIIVILNKFFPIRQTNDGIFLDMSKEV